MRKMLVLGLVSALAGLLVLGCAQTQETATTTTVAGATTTTVAGATTTTVAGATTTVSSSTTTTTGGVGGVTVSNLFDVYGAQAVAKAQAVSGTGVNAKASGTADLLKMDSSGKLSSILNSQLGYNPGVTVIETNPKDGSLYVGFASKVSVAGVGTTDAYGQEGAAFFRVKTDGSIEVVDADISGMGSWYSDYAYSSYYAELPVKQVQFDADGNAYYLGMVYQTAIYTKALKMKPYAGGPPVQIGSSNQYIRDFLVEPNGWIIFHGSDSDSYSTEWLRVMPSTDQIWNLFYSGGSGWMPSSTVGLRSYYHDKSNNVMLVGLNLPFEDENFIPIGKHSGVIRVRLDTSGKPATPEVLYDDNNMYNTGGYGSIGSQLAYGYWDSSGSGTYKKFFKMNNYYNLTLPLSLETGVTEASIRAYIRGKFKTTTLDTLNNVTFGGTTTSETWLIPDALDSLINANISGETWAQWISSSGLSTGFGSARQILYLDDGSVYAIMRLDQWGSSGAREKGDKIFRIINKYGTAEPTALPQPAGTNAGFKVIEKSRSYHDSQSNKDYIVFLGESLSGSANRVFAIDASSSESTPVDITNGLGAQIFNLVVNEVKGTVLYDVWTYKNKSYLAESNIVTQAVVSTSESTEQQVTDMVPFEANVTTTTTTSTTTTAGETGGTTTTLETTTTIR